MPEDLEPKWWQHRRVQWPLWSLLAIIAAVTIALFRSNVSRIVVRNDTGEGIPSLTISACGQSRTFEEVGYLDSIRLSLEAKGGESEISLSTNGVVIWHGEFIEPRGGYRAFLCLRRDGSVEGSVGFSLWQQLWRNFNASAP